MPSKSNGCTPLVKFFDDYYRPNKRLMDSTAGIYGVTLRSFARALHRQPILDDLTEDKINKFLCHYSRGHRPDTTRTLRKHLIALATYAHKRGLLTEVPDVPHISATNRMPEAYTPEEMSRLIEAAKSTPGWHQGIRRSRILLAIILVAYDTGQRGGTIKRLLFSDIRPDIPAILFRAGLTGKQRHDQLLRISESTLEAIEAIREPEREFIFYTVMCSATWYSQIRKTLKRAGLPFGRRDQLQRIRRTTATLMHRAGGDATMQLGHSSDAITRRHYLDTSADLQAVDLIPRLAKKADTPIPVPAPAAADSSLSFTVCVGI